MFSTYLYSENAYIKRSDISFIHLCNRVPGCVLGISDNFLAVSNGPSFAYSRFERCVRLSCFL